MAIDETVFDVPAKLSTRVRVYSTGHGNKTDLGCLARPSAHFNARGVPTVRCIAGAFAQTRSGLCGARLGPRCGAAGLLEVGILGADMCGRNHDGARMYRRIVEYIEMDRLAADEVVELYESVGRSAYTSDPRRRVGAIERSTFWEGRTTAGRAWRRSSSAGS